MPRSTGICEIGEVVFFRALIFDSDSLISALELTTRFCHGPSASAGLKPELNCVRLLSLRFVALSI